MSGGGAIVAIMAAAAALARQQVLDAFRTSGATAPERARTLESLGLKRDGAFDHLERAGVLRAGSAPATFYLDEIAYVARRDRKPSRATIIILVTLAVAVVALLATLIITRKGRVRTRFVVDAEGIGRVRTGTTLPELSALLGEVVRAAYADFEACDYVRPRALPRGVSLMVLSDTIARVEVNTRGVKTVEGAAVGDSEQRVLELYKGRIHVEPHKYTGPEGHYLVVTPPGDTRHRIIFETDGKVVTLYRAGRRPAVEYVEGCA